MESNDLLKAWVHFLSDPESKESREYAEKIPEIKKAIEELERLSRDPEMVALAEARERELQKNNK